MTVSSLSNDDLLKALEKTCMNSRRLLARLLVQLGEVEARMLHAEAAYPSLFEFCVRKLGMSEGEAYRRVAGARVVRKFPALLPWLEAGRLHLTTIVTLRELWTSDNLDELATIVAGKSKLEVAREVARRRPQPDAPDMIRKLPPARDASSRDASEGASASSSPGQSRAPSSESVPAPLGTGPQLPTSSLDVEAFGSSSGQSPSRGVVKPLSAERYKFQFTAGEEFRRKLEAVQDMLRHRNPRGDLEPIFELAIEALTAQLEKERFAATDRPQQKLRPADDDHVRAATRREVTKRDELQCTYVANGVRCSAKGFLEIDHIDPRGKGGRSEAENLRIYCREHNRLWARQVYGADYVERAIAVRAHLRKRAGLGVRGGVIATKSDVSPEGGAQGPSPWQFALRAGDRS